MVVISMLLSGAVAGLIGMPVLFGQAHNYGTSFQVGIGFAGIAVALLGRNNPVGIAFGALIFAFLSEQAGLLNILVQISPEIVAVTQGIIVLAVVVAYEVVRRYRVRLEQATVASEMAAPAGAEATA
jgi:general nucleoside transport system permease protein